MFGWFRKSRVGPRETGVVALGRRDCHSHVLPGVDDGSRTLSESLAMLTLLERSQVEIVVATPHIFPGKFDNEPEGLHTVFETLCAATKAAGLQIALELGAEHFLDESLQERVEAGRAIAFGPERYILFETATGEHVPPWLMDTVYAMVAHGYTPLMAHPERYRYLRGEDGFELCEDLRAAGVRFQVNRTVGKANRGGVGPRGNLIAKLMARGWIDETGSDLHRPTADGRPDVIVRA